MNTLKNNPEHESFDGAEQAHLSGCFPDHGKDAMNAIKLRLDASFDEMAARIPAVASMVGFDQKNDHHALTLDEHVKQVVKGLLENEFIASHPKKNLIVLAGYLHDIGKTSPEGQQIHRRDPEKRQYVDHEKVSVKMASPILINEFESMSDEDLEFVLSLIKLHASALNLVGNFEKNDHPKGSALEAYSNFIGEVEKIPGDLSTLDKMKIVFAFNKADKLGGYNEKSDKNNPRIAAILSKSKKQAAVLNEMIKALPALLEAVKARRGGLGNAGITKENGQYKLRDLTKIETAMDEESIRLIMKNAGKIGVPDSQFGVLGNTLRTKGLDGLEAAGFGTYLEQINKLLLNN